MKFQQAKNSKYGAKKTTLDGIAFDSKALGVDLVKVVGG